MGRIWAFGDNVDTDQIVPGRYAPYMTGESPVRYAFVERRPEFAASVRPGDVLAAGDNFGCGSSREYAMEALVGCGLAAIVACSFARIFYRNAVNLGLPVYEAPFARDLPDGAEVTLHPEDGRLVVDGRPYVLPPMPAFQREIIAAGGLVPYIRMHGRFPVEAEPATAVAWQTTPTAVGTRAPDAANPPSSDTTTSEHRSAGRLPCDRSRRHVPQG